MTITAPSQESPMSGPITTVLVVEDEDSFVDALTVGLAREGFRVQVARDGAQALEVFDAVAPDLVLPLECAACGRPGVPMRAR